MLSENLVDLFDSKKIPKNRNLVSKHESNQRNKQAFLEKKKWIVILLEKDAPGSKE